MSIATMASAVRLLDERLGHDFFKWPFPVLPGGREGSFELSFILFFCNLPSLLRAIGMAKCLGPHKCSY